MTGLTLSEAYFREFGEPMLERDFGSILPRLAIGLCGSGSECYGYDDEISRDHDFEPGFCIFLPDEAIVDTCTEFALSRAYAQLPAEYSGFCRNRIGPVGGNRHGVIRSSDFFISKCGSPDGVLTMQAWLDIPEHYLLEAVNGRIFRDDSGVFTSIRTSLASMPEDIILKKLSGSLLAMAQSGQYNYARCISRGDTAAAQLAVIEFVRSAMHAAFLLNGRYMPYYKWRFRAFRELPFMGSLHESFEFLISSDNSGSNAELKKSMIEDTASVVIGELKKRSLTQAVCNDLEKHAYSVNDHIRDNTVRTMDIFAAE